MLVIRLQKWTKRRRPAMTATLLIQVVSTRTRCWRNETIHASAVSSASIKEIKSMLHSHADICATGATWKGMEYTGSVCNVYSYSNSYKPLKQVPLVGAVTAYSHPIGEMLVLVLGWLIETKLTMSQSNKIICNSEQQYPETATSQLQVKLFNLQSRLWFTMAIIRKLWCYLL